MVGGPPVGNAKGAARTEQELLGKLRQSEAQYRSTIDSMPDALHVVDRDLRIILVNEAFMEWHRRLGIPTDVVGKRLTDLYPFLPATVEDEYACVLTKGKMLVTEECSRVGQEDIFTETRKIPVLENDEVIEIITIVRDITGRKHMELALRHSEAKFRALAEQSPNMILVNQRDRIVYVNRKCVEIMGYTREEFYSGKFDFFCLIAPESGDEVAKGYSTYMDSGTEYSHECTLMSKAGKKIECIVSLACIDMDEGEALLGVVTDITDRKRTEDALRVSEEKYRSFVENFHGIAYRGGLGGAPAFFHGDVRRITGYTAEEFMSGAPRWVDIVYPVDRKMFEEGSLPAKLLDADRPIELEYRIRRRDGQVRWIHQSLRSVLDSSGDPIYLQGALYDVTERRLAEDTLLRERSAFGIITEAALKGSDASEVCEHVLKGLADTLGFDCGTVRLYDPESKMLRPAGTYGLSESEVEAYIGDQHIEDPRYIAARVGRTLTPIWAPDVSVSEDLKQYLDRLAEVRVRAMISWPLVSTSGNLLAVMHLLGREPKDIPEANREFFRTVSEMFAVVLERKSVEAALRNSEARYRSRFEDSPIALWEEDFSGAKRHIDSLKSAGVDDFRKYFREHPEDVVKCAEAVRIIGANRAAMDLYGVGTLKDFETVSTADIRTGIGDVFREGLILAANGSKDFELEYETSTAQGEGRLLWLRWSAAPGCENTLERVLVSVVDLTKRKEAE